MFSKLLNWYIKGENKFENFQIDWWHFGLVGVKRERVQFVEDFV